MRQLPSNLLRNAHWQRQLIDCCSLPAPQISTQVLGRLYKESSGGTFQFKLNCGPLNLFSKRLCLISYASAPSEFLTCSREPPPFLQPSQQVPGCFFSLQRIDPDGKRETQISVLNNGRAFPKAQQSTGAVSAGTHTSLR